jgi:hypothetical protein
MSFSSLRLATSRRSLRRLPTPPPIAHPPVEDAGADLIPPERASYLAKYLSKQRPECFKGWRIWAGFGEWEWTKVKGVVFDSLFCRIYRACKEAFSWTGNKSFRDRMRLVQWLEIRTITEGWKEGLGPSEKPYWMCCVGEHTLPESQVGTGPSSAQRRPAISPDSIKSGSG